MIAARYMERVAVHVTRGSARAVMMVISCRMGHALFVRMGVFHVTRTGARHVIEDML